MTTSTLAGKSVVLTGKLDQLGMLRDEAIRALNTRGAYVQDAVDEGTDFLVQGRPPGRETVKARRARALGIPVIDQRDFAELLDRADKVEARKSARPAPMLPAPPLPRPATIAPPPGGYAMPAMKPGVPTPPLDGGPLARPLSERVARGERPIDRGLGDILADLAARERRDEREW